MISIGGQGRPWISRDIALVISPLGKVAIGQTGPASDIEADHSRGSDR